MNTYTATSSESTAPRVIQTFTGDSTNVHLVMDDPFTYACSGTYCSECPFAVFIKPSIGDSGTLSFNANHFAKFMLKHSDGKLYGFWPRQHYSFFSSTQLYAYRDKSFYQTGTLIAMAPFLVYVQFGPYWMLPNCNPHCLKESPTSPGVYESIENRIYKVGTVCYEAQAAKCSGTCLTGPASFPEEMYPLPNCPDKLCDTSVDKLTLVQGQTTDLLVDISEMAPFEVDLSSRYTIPTNLEVVTQLSNATSASSYQMIDAAFTSIMSSTGTKVKFVAPATPVEIPQTNFHMEVKIS